MTITTLTRKDLAPDTASYQLLFTQADLTDTAFSFSRDLQPRLFYALKQLLMEKSVAPFMLIKAPEEAQYLQWLTEETRRLYQPAVPFCGVNYQVNGGVITATTAQSADDNFADTTPVDYAEWIEHEQLFGCVRQFNGEISLQPGLVHRTNGGILILSLRTLLTQPLLWLRLKNMMACQRFDWLSPDESRPLPVTIPSMPLNLKVILVGERESLADFQEQEPELFAQAIYSEYEESLHIVNEGTLKQWCQWVTQNARQLELPELAADAWPLLIHEGARYTGDQTLLPLCLLWIARQLRAAATFCEDKIITAAAIRQMLSQRAWCEGYLSERLQNEILQQQIRIDTEGHYVGQINALSVIEFPGHPQATGEPTRISCVVHAGDGEVIDIERKAELGGNIHAKGMMIMQAFLMSGLDPEQQFPFTVSLTFEQSYSEIDGDSASLAELCALISALACVPIDQSIAVTGSVDQFGRVQPVGGVNEKIEGFFAICQQRGLTGKQGVIIPAANIQHLSLPTELQQAVTDEQFYIWAVEDVTEALPVLTQRQWEGGEEQTLRQIIHERMTQMTQQEGRHRLPWPLRWLAGLVSH
ncbi:Lon protease family protein [Enterobacteriaceae bacterium ESL0689]|nr:Lon protease family protein [Enterobacteriaceae bacterium ESL0689]